MREKGQAAMEYLMTYGWAILIIIVVVGALFAMGVFRTETTVTCSPCFGYFAYVDYSDGNLLIRNGPREVNITVSSTPSGATTTECTSASPCGPGSDIEITTIPTDQGDVSIDISYTDTSSGYTHDDSATIHP